MGHALQSLKCTFFNIDIQYSMHCFNKYSSNWKLLLASPQEAGGIIMKHAFLLSLVLAPPPPISYCPSCHHSNKRQLCFLSLSVLSLCVADRDFAIGARTEPMPATAKKAWPSLIGFCVPWPLVAYSVFFVFQNI